MKFHSKYLIYFFQSMKIDKQNDKKRLKFGENKIKNFLFDSFLLIPISLKIIWINSENDVGIRISISLYFR